MVSRSLGRASSEETASVLAVLSAPTVSVEDAAHLLGTGRSTLYRALNNGTAPVTSVRIGRVVRVVSASLTRALELGTPTDVVAVATVNRSSDCPRSSRRRAG